MLVVILVIAGYVAARLIVALRSSADLESAISRAAVTPEERRKRLGHAESVGIRVRDVTGLVSGLRWQKRRRARWALIVWTVAPSSIILLDWNLTVGACTLLTILTLSSLRAVVSFFRSVASLRTISGRTRSLLIFGLVFLTVAAGTWLALWGARESHWPWPANFGVRLLAGLIATVLGIALIALGAQGLAALTRRNNTTGSTSFAFQSGATLWLRSFGDDNITIRAPGPFGVLSWAFGFRVRLEELVAGWVAIDAPLVAIGKPGERYPLLGAARTYFPDHEWQNAVRRAVASAGQVVLLAGSSRGLGWETDYVARDAHRHRVLILLPPLPYENSLRRLENLRVQLGLSDLEVLDGAAPGTSTQFSLNVVAIGFSKTNRPVYYCGYGRSALDLEAAVGLGSLTIRDIISDPPCHGEIRREFDPRFPLSPQ